MLQKSSMQKVMGLFFENPTLQFSLKDVSTAIDLAHTSTKTNITKLLKKELLIQTIQKRGTRKFPLYEGNRNSNDFREYKKLHNIQCLIESNAVKFIEENVMPKCIIVFGSFQKGEDTEQSDIDIFVESNEVKLDLSKFEKKLKRKIQLHFNDCFTSYPTELKNNIINGRVLKGYLEGY